MALIDGLIAYYKLDEASGTTAADAHSADDGTTTGATVNAAGKINTAYSFDGTSDYITITRTAEFNTMADGDHSFQLWINSGSTTAVKRMIGMNDAGSGSRAVLFNHPALGKIKFYEGSGNDADALDSTISTLNNNAWRHIVVTLSGTTMTIYIDGASDGTKTKTAGTASDTDFFIGANQGDPAGNGFEGTIDEVGIWNRALTSTEVSQLYNSGNGLAYPLVKNVTITPSALALSFTQAVPVLEIVSVIRDLSFVTVGTGSSSSKYLKTSWPFIEGLQAGTNLLRDKAHLEADEEMKRGYTQPKEMKTEWPVEEGLIAGTTKHPAKPHLEAEEEELPEGEKWGGV